MSVLDRLILGRQRIEQGWNQFTLKSITQPYSYCALGAISDFEYQSDNIERLKSVALTEETRVYLENFLPIIIRPKNCCPKIIMWNDRTYRTKEEVLALFDRAIAAKRKELGIIEQEEIKENVRELEFA